jgi:putative polyhydroxyalkanoate system protein
MGRMSLEMPHKLGKAEAKKRVEALTQHWGSKYGVTTKWAGDTVSFSGKVMGVNLDGNLTIFDDKVAGDASDPGLLLRSQAKKYVEKKFASFLDPSRNVADLTRGD